MEFEYDQVKSVMNNAKHGIDFEKASVLWSDPGLKIATGRTLNEERWIAIGLIQGKHWSVVFTPRGDAVRIISARRSRRKEIEFYES
jgi:uncharacterized DUF497 family protein